MVYPNHRANVGVWSKGRIGRAKGGGLEEPIIARGWEASGSQHVRIGLGTFAIVVQGDVKEGPQRWIGANISRIRAAPSHGDLSAV